jgi:anaerobic selenocysteine-containing dehydrogenase/Fe-S-cluster-containing dehydrogenase component
MDRRGFLRLVAGTGAAQVGLAKRWPDRWISYVMERPQIAPGLWTILATTCRECPAGCGMYVRCKSGRVVKPEGNPEHPVSHGGLCARGQSAPQGLYDPDRVPKPLQAGGHGFEPIPWSTAMADVADAIKKADRLFLVSDLQTGAMGEVMQEFHKSLAKSGQIAFYEAYAYEPLRAANQRLFGRPVVPRFKLDQCDLVLSFGTDFLESWISDVEFASQLAKMHHGGPADRGPQSLNPQIAERQPPGEDPAEAYPLPPANQRPSFSGEMIYIGPRLSMTAANADRFIRIPAGQECPAALAILREVLRLQGEAGGTDVAGASPPVEGLPQETVSEVARRFAGASNAVALGAPVAATGPAAEQLATAAMLLNHAAGAIGRAVDFSQIHALSRTTGSAQLQEMLKGLGQGDMLIVHETNPAYSIPALREPIQQAGQVLYLGTMMNETARLARWVLPVVSPLEMWGDYEPWTGVHCLIQPMMGTLHDARHAGDVLLMLAQQRGQALHRQGQAVQDFRDWLMLRWRQLHDQLSPQADFEMFWRTSLQKGHSVAQVKSEPPPTLQKQASVVEPPAEAQEELHLWLCPSILLFDGRTANRGWMQEIPQRMSTLTWGSSIDISPATARRLAVAPGDMIEVSNGFGSVQAPAYVTGDVADNVAALAFGQGHTGFGEVADNRGANAFRLLARGGPGSLFGAVAVRKTGRCGPLITLSGTQEQYGRGVVKWIPRQTVQTMQPSDVEEIIWPLPKGYDPHRDLYPPHEYPNHRWAMVIDLDRCIGCGACTTACYAENNIPVMGPQPLIRNRELTWLRVPPYRHPQDALRVGFLVLPCQHCDAAPCEPVCPVFAAVHNDQGLNAQIYNRCIGTRFCSNNCPYKVRRFEWFNPHWREPLNLQLNPDVDVRCRGVMEKCTFCIQRILYAERQAKVEGRPLRDGEIQPACVQSCPTKAFVFGDLMQPDSQVSKLFEHPRRYQLLKELNTKPAVIYLKRIEVQPAERA